MTMRLLLLLALSGCVVEAGNPTSKKTKPGQINIRLVQSESTLGELATLNVDQLRLYQADGSSVAVPLMTNSVSLYSSNQNSEVVLAEKQEVDAGSYDRVAFQLNNTSPIDYRNKAGEKLEIGLAEDIKAGGFTFEQAVEVTADNVAELVLFLDPGMSFQKQKDQGVIFRPRGRNLSGRKRARLEGSAPIDDAVVACAYLYSPPPPLDPGPPPGQRLYNEYRRHEDREREPKYLERGEYGVDKWRDLPPPPPGKVLLPANIYEGEDKVPLDSEATCENATFRTSVSDGRYIFSPALPGKYLLRFFRSNDTFVDDRTAL